MAKQSIFGRISTLVKANVNAMLDSAEDPQKMLDQLVRDFTNNIADAESAIAETIGNLRLLERDHEEDVKAAAECDEEIGTRGGFERGAQRRFLIGGDAESDWLATQCAYRTRNEKGVGVDDPAAIERFARHPQLGAGRQHGHARPPAHREPGHVHRRAQRHVARA